jgi:hypothetical protein
MQHAFLTGIFNRTKKNFPQGTIDFCRAILADTPLKGASFAPASTRQSCKPVHGIFIFIQFIIQ